MCLKKRKEEIVGQFLDNLPILWPFNIPYLRKITRRDCLRARRENNVAGGLLCMPTSPHEAAKGYAAPSSRVRN